MTSFVRGSQRVFATALVSAGVVAATSAQAPMEKGRLGIALTDIMRPWTGDLGGMVERRMIRVLTAYSRTQYFIDRGTPRGIAYDQGKLLEAAVNEASRSGYLSVNVHFVPMARDELLPALLAGKGDVVMANLTVTPNRAAVVDFADPWIGGIDEIVVTSPRAPDITTVDDLSGKEVFVRESSSYFDSLRQLNARFARDGKAPVILTPAPEELEDEDLLEMTSVGLVDIVVVDNHKAWFWQRV